MKINRVILLFPLCLWLPGSGFGADSGTIDTTAITSLQNDTSVISVDSIVTKPQPLSHPSKPQIDSTISDSIKRANLRESLLEQEKQRSMQHIHQNIDKLLYDPSNLSSSILFLSDGTSPSELLRSHPLVTTARYGLSTSINRYMIFGAVAPVNKVYTGNLLYNHSTSSTIKGTDQVSAVDLSDIYFTDFGAVAYHYNPDRIISPEALIFWENGVFNERLLQVSISRPISRNLIINAFTNYRYFKEGVFSQSADISSFYGNLGDTAYLADKGYNPLTDEFMAGASFSWIGDNQSKLHLKMTYGDLKHEISENKPAQLREDLIHAEYKRYPFQLNTGTSWKINERFFVDFEGIFREEPAVRTTGDSVENKILPKRQDARDRELDLAIRTGIELQRKDSLGISYNLNRTGYILFDKSDVLSWLHRPEACYNHHFDLWNFQGLVRATAGLTYYTLEDTSEIVPVWNAGVSAQKNNQRYSIHVELDNIPFIVDHDSLWFNQVLLDSYYKAGAQAYWKWNRADLLVGYQLVYGPDSATVSKSWPCGIAPYQQPVSSFIIAPSLGRWHGFAFKSSINISDSRPYLKIHSILSFTAHPLNTQEYIDAALTFDYWSERDRISYAGFTDWNVPIYNLGLEASAHIRSFRLFYKVDNILNRRFAYLPGYYSPGITFRWGFNWFLQR
jgi:hypothetical protein